MNQNEVRFRATLNQALLWFTGRNFSIMHPILFTFGPVTVYTFGLFLVLAFFSAVFTVWLFGRREGFEEEKILDACFFSSLVGLFGGRIAFFLSHPHLFCFSCFFRFSATSGFSWLGGLFSGFIGLWYFARKNKIEFVKIADLLVCGLSLAEGIGYLGCFFSGTGYGKETSFFWGVRQVGLLGKRHPVQIFQSIACFLIFYLLLRFKKKRHFSGFLILFYSILRSWSFFLLDFFKEEGVYLGKLKFSQWVGLFLGIGGVFYFYRRERRSLRKDLENTFAWLIERGGKIHLFLLKLRRGKKYGKDQKEALS